MSNTLVIPRASIINNKFDDLEIEEEEMNPEIELTQDLTNAPSEEKEGFHLPKILK